MLIKFFARGVGKKRKLDIKRQDSFRQEVTLQEGSTSRLKIKYPPQLSRPQSTKQISRKPKDRIIDASRPDMRLLAVG